MTPIALGNSATLRVGEGVIVIGFPLASELGQEPTVSQGIVSAIRGNVLQTDAPVNPGNSGGPMLDHSGNVVGIVSSRLETTTDGRTVSGIGFAIPINAAVAGLAGAPATPVPNSTAVPTPIPTAVPPIPPTIYLQATKEAIDAENARLQTRTAVERENEQAIQEAQDYARSVEATRVANLPTATPSPTPTPEPTPTPLPTATPHPRIHCQEWEAMVLEWIYQGNNYHPDHPGLPVHSQLPIRNAVAYCITSFPMGQMSEGDFGRIGTAAGEFVPGTYEFRGPGGNRVDGNGCRLALDMTGNRTEVALPYGEPFQFTFYEYHGMVVLIVPPDRDACRGSLHRVGS